MEDPSVASRDEQRVIDFYAQPAAMASGGKYAVMLAKLPTDVAELARIVQGLAIHEYVASALYGVTIPDKRKSETHIRPVESMLDRLFAIDAQPLSVARAVDKRLVGVCHHFMLLLVAMLRAKGIPARARCGFGAYFNPGYFEDHWVSEYWNAAEARWVRVDAQLDELAALTREPDTAFAELRALYKGDDRLRVPAAVRNAVLNRTEMPGVIPRPD